MNHAVDRMSFPGFDPRGFTSFAQIQKEVEEFALILRQRGIDITPRSPLDEMCLTLLGLEEQRKNTALVDANEDIRVALRGALGLHDIIRRIVRLHGRPEFAMLEGHLRLLNSSTVAQNIAAPGDKVAAKLFELLIGLVCLEAGKNLQVEEPHQSYGDNPDILVDLDGRRWGFACKVLYGRSPIILFERLQKGVDQIEASPAEIGCTIINLKNQIDHDETWVLANPAVRADGTETPTFGAWRDIADPRDMLSALAERRHEELLTVNGEDAVKSLFEGKKSILGALLFLQTATALASPHGPVNTTVGIFSLMILGDMAPGALETLDRLNHAMHHRS